jgi:hypothetical protein
MRLSRNDRRLPPEDSAHGSTADPQAEHTREKALRRRCNPVVLRYRRAQAAWKALLPFLCSVMRTGRVSSGFVEDEV